MFTKGTWGTGYADKFLADTGYEKKLKTGTIEAIDVCCGNGYHLETFCDY